MKSMNSLRILFLLSVFNVVALSAHEDPTSPDNEGHESLHTEAHLSEQNLSPDTDAPLLAEEQEVNGEDTTTSGETTEVNTSDENVTAQPLNDDITDQSFSEQSVEPESETATAEPTTNEQEKGVPHLVILPFFAHPTSESSERGLNEASLVEKPSVSLENVLTTTRKMSGTNRAIVLGAVTGMVALGGLLYKIG